MNILFHSKHVRIHWQFLDKEYMDPECGNLIGLHFRFWKFERGWFLRFTGDMKLATVRYDYIWNGKRTTWRVQSPVYVERTESWF